VAMSFFDPDDFPVSLLITSRAGFGPITNILSYIGCLSIFE
jgi:hypothetical protein